MPTNGNGRRNFFKERQKEREREKEKNSNPQAHTEAEAVQQTKQSQPQPKPQAQPKPQTQSKPQQSEQKNSGGRRNQQQSQHREQAQQQKEQIKDQQVQQAQSQQDEANVQIAADEVAVVVDKDADVEIIGIRFKNAGKVYYFSPNGIKFEAGDNAIAETARGLEYGKVILDNRIIKQEAVVGVLKSVVRKATVADDEKFEANQRLKSQAHDVCLEKIAHHDLKMKLVDVEYTFDNNKLIFYFTADGRVDFRELVKDLASVFKTRIELRQIGIRDETKIKGGLSVCGRPFCCNTFLNDFTQVSIKIAKEQGLSINSSKISGACGKLMCCLKYEQEAYEYESALTPKLSSIVETPSGQGVVVDRQVLVGMVRVRLNATTDHKTEVFHRSKVKVIGFVESDRD